MINISNIKHGWLTLSINGLSNDLSFTISYLTDVKSQLERIYSLEEYNNLGNPITLCFDGEGKDLYLTCRREFGYIVIIWEELSNRGSLYKFEFDYNDFVKELKELFVRIHDDYYKNFDLDNYFKEVEK